MYRFPSSKANSDDVKLIGTESNVARAQQHIEELVERMEREAVEREKRNFSITIEVDSKYHPKIIGRGGKAINAIRDDTGCRVDLPKVRQALRCCHAGTGKEACRGRGEGEGRFTCGNAEQHCVCGCQYSRCGPGGYAITGMRHNCLAVFERLCMFFFVALFKDACSPTERGKRP